MAQYDWGEIGTTSLVPTPEAAGMTQPTLDGLYDDGVTLQDQPEGPLTRMSLHPELRLLVDSNLSGDSVDAKNLCTVVGTIKHERYASGKVRSPMTTALGARQSPFRLEVEEVAGDAEGALVTAYSMQLSIGAKLLDSGIFADNTRVAISGPLRLERTYDRQFAVSDTDQGMPVWETRIDVITVQSVDDTVPDGSWVQLEGEVDGPPQIRTRPIGPGSLIPFASVRVRYRRSLRGAFPNSKARHPINIMVPLEVPLDGTIEHVGALLRSGNAVRIEGRLAPYAYRRQMKDGRISTAVDRAEEQIRERGGTDVERRLRGMRYRMLNAVQMSVGVGYVELHHGTMLQDEDIGRLIEERPRTPRRSAGTGADHQAGRHGADEVDAADLTAQLDVATSAALLGTAVDTDTPVNTHPTDAELPAVPREPLRRRRLATTDSLAAGESTAHDVDNEA